MCCDGYTYIFIPTQYVCPTFIHSAKIFCDSLVNQYCLYLQTYNRYLVLHYGALRHAGVTRKIANLSQFMANNLIERFKYAMTAMNLDRRRSKWSTRIRGYPRETRWSAIEWQKWVFRPFWEYCKNVGLRKKILRKHFWRISG